MASILRAQLGQLLVRRPSGRTWGVLGHRAGAYYTGRMRLATLRDGTRDGALLVVGARRRGRTRARRRSRRRCRRRSTTGTARRRRWRALAATLDGGGASTSRSTSRASGRRCRARTNGSTGRRSSNHVRLVREARGAAPPATLETDPLVYQGGSGVLLGPARRHPARRSDLGPRLRERRSASILGDTPQGTRAADAPRARAAADARQRRHAARTWSPTSWPRGSASSSRSRRRRSRRSRSRPTSWAARGATAACTAGCARPTTARSSAIRDAGRDALLVLRSRSPTSRARARSPPARSWAAARSRTPTARAASPAWPSGARSRQIDGGRADDAVHEGGRHGRDRDARRARARPVRPHRAEGGEAA